VGLLLAHPWFNRTWIIQEIAVASVVHLLYKGTRFRDTDIARLLQVVSSNPGQLLRLQVNTAFAVRDNDADMKQETLVEDGVLLERARSCSETLCWIRESFQNGFGLSFPLVLRHTLLSNARILETEYLHCTAFSTAKRH
jgi:hypothetical protein